MHTTEFISKGSELDFDVNLYFEELFFEKFFPTLGIDPKVEIEYITSNINVHWEFYIEMRSYGIKDIGVYATKIDLDFDVDYYVKMDNPDGVLEYINIEMNKHIKDFEVNTENSNTFNGNDKTTWSVEDVDIDFKAKIVYMV